MEKRNPLGYMKLEGGEKPIYATNTDWSLKTLARSAAGKHKFLSVLTEHGKVLKSNHALEGF